MNVPYVPNRSRQHFGTRSSCRSRCSHHLKGGNVGNADPAMNRKASDLVPMLRFSFGGVTGHVTVAFSLPKKSGEK